MEASVHSDITASVAQELPFLRRYARALTGNQQSGDHYAAATLEAILEDLDSLRRASSVRAGLFGAFHQIWVTSGTPVEELDADNTPEATAQRRLSALTPNTREALLLHSIEGFSGQEVAEIVNVGKDEANELISIARTRDQAVELARKDMPDMILADIQLADKSSGIDAVSHILSEMGEIPVVFITAFPERLLTGERPEPAFLITKPYTEEQVQSAVSQAMFFASTETLKA
jgi:DNA-directed RNA polymerase specialized sigma24 family protein